LLRFGRLLSSTFRFFSIGFGGFFSLFSFVVLDKDEGADVTRARVDEA